MVLRRFHLHEEAPAESGRQGEIWRFSSQDIPVVRDIAPSAEEVFHNLVFVSIRKTYPMQAYKSPCGRPPGTASGAWG
jgi:3-polyprenyl-4-hydroxybenzoate decarboxylase